MWTSYEALCEMGALCIDPTTVFGVRPAEIERLQERFHQQNLGQEEMPLQEKSVLTPHHFTPPTHGVTATVGGTGTSRPMELGTPSTAASIGPKASLFQTAQKPKATLESGSAAILPNQLQFDTPNLTPIPMQQDASFIHQHQHQGISANGVTFHRSSMMSEADIPFSDSFNPYTVRRAKYVAARLYYQPSPETRPYDGVPPIGRSHDESRDPSSRRYLRGKSALRTTVSTKIDHEPPISETPLRRGGRPSDVSTVRRPRALFLSENKAMRENTNDLNQSNGGSLEDEEDENFRPIVSRGPGDDLGSDLAIDNENHPDDEPPNRMMTEDSVSTTNGVNLEQQLPHLAEDGKPPGSLAIQLGELAEDTIIERHSAVQHILELLCLLGAGYWRLCQVCFV
jgi:hypothetical protein